MDVDRRTVLAASPALLASAVSGAAGAGVEASTGRTMRRIATEEAWSFPEHVDRLSALAQSSWDNLDVINIGPGGIGVKTDLGRRLVDIDERLRTMDQLGVDMHVLSLTSPGVQAFNADIGAAIATEANDRLAEIVARYPTRFAGLASFAPQDPKRAAIEMDRAVGRLKLNGFIVNSHTNNEYLDDPKYWPVLEAAEALGAPIYIHPRCPADSMAGPFRGIRMQAAIWGYQAETGTHAMRLILSGVLDRFPKLQIVLGHMGENIPFHLWRSDHWFNRRPQSYASKLPPSEVFRRNFVITTSGVEHGPALKYAIEVLGADKVLWAIDYPYEAMPPSVDFMNRVDIPEDVRAKVFHLNAERAFRIAPA
jgi:5-carboxyvanillate decarboxylase